MKKVDGPKYITFTKARNIYYLTKSMFEDLDPPDLTLKNPHYRNGPPMKLYLIERIESWIEANSDRVAKAKAHREKVSKKLSEAQKERYRKLRAELEKELEQWTPELIYPLTPSVILEAHDYYRERYRDYKGKLTYNGLVAFIRHNYTNYHYGLMDLDRLKDPYLTEDLYMAIRRKVDRFVRGILMKEFAIQADKHVANLLLDRQKG